MFVSAPMLLPPATWWSALAVAGAGEIRPAVQYDKAAGYSRLEIASAEGPLLLPVPLVGGRPQRGVLLSEIRIDHSTHWAVRYWRSLFSAYGRAPYFEQYAGPLEQWLLTRHELLVDMALAGIDWLRPELLPEVPLTINPDPEPRRLALPAAAVKPYHQVFSDRHGFLPGLSVIDLLMNEGPGGRGYVG